MDEKNITELSFDDIFPPLEFSPDQDQSVYGSNSLTLDDDFHTAYDPDCDGHKRSSSFTQPPEAAEPENEDDYDSAFDYATSEENYPSGFQPPPPPENPVDPFPLQGSGNFSPQLQSPNFNTPIELPTVIDKATHPRGSIDDISLIVLIVSAFFFAFFPVIGIVVNIALIVKAIQTKSNYKKQNRPSSCLIPVAIVLALILMAFSVISSLPVITELITVL